MPLLALLPLLAQVAPLAAHWIGRAIDGPGGAAHGERIARDVTGLLDTLFGTSDPDAVRASIEAEPEKAASLARSLDAIALELQTAIVRADVENARSAREALQSGAWWVRAAPGLLSLVIVLGFFGTLGLLVTGRFPGSDTPALRELLSLLLGALTLAFGDVRNFWLGSSAGSRKKDEALAGQAQEAVRMLAQQAPAVVAAPAPVPAPAAPPPAAAPTVAGAPSPWRKHFADATGWRLTEAGLVIEGATAPERTVGAPVTVRRIWAGFGPLIQAASNAHGVPVELIVATIATESGGRADATRREPDGRVSAGLMQTLTGTAAEMLGRPVSAESLRDPALSIEAGARYLRRQRGATEFQPPLVAAAYNAGSLRRATGNRWKLRSTGDHIDRYCRFFNDACAVAKEDRWFG